MFRGEDTVRAGMVEAGLVRVHGEVLGDPGAEIAAGFRETLTKEQVREATLSGDVERLLAWHPAAAGDTFFIPAGTVHAIGAGLTICEIQQHSDITYRLYDYGRGRELHLDQALAVSRLGPHAARSPLPISCPYFVAEKVEVNGSASLPAVANWSLAIVTEGSGTLNGQPTQAGDVWLAGSQVIEIADKLQVIRAHMPLR